MGNIQTITRSNLTFYFNFAISIGQRKNSLFNSCSSFAIEKLNERQRWMNLHDVLKRLSIQL